MKKLPQTASLPGAAALLLAVLLTACLSGPTPRAEDLKRLQGYWEGSGPGGPCSVTISGNSLRFDAREDFWFETTFTLPARTDPRQLHATIIDESAPEDGTIGKVVVTLFKIEGEALTFGVVDDFDGPPESPVNGNWDRITDRFDFKRANPPNQDE